MLLAHGLEFEASFLLHQGLTPSLEFLNVALTYQRYFFVLDFIQIFLAYTPPSPKALREIPSLILSEMEHSNEYLEFLLFVAHHFTTNFIHS